MHGINRRLSKLVASIITLCLSASAALAATCNMSISCSVVSPGVSAFQLSGTLSGNPSTALHGHLELFDGSIHNIDVTSTSCSTDSASAIVQFPAISSGLLPYGWAIYATKTQTGFVGMFAVHGQFYPPEEDSVTPVVCTH